MTRLWAGMWVLCWGLASSAAGCRVTAVSDGDTVRCLQDGRELTLRLSQIDAPEHDQPAGQSARAALAARVLGRNVTVERHDTDQYGRWVARLWLADVDINLAQVADGWAWAYRDYLKEPHYVAAENAARAAQRGLWADRAPVRPQDWRHGLRHGSALPLSVPPAAANPAHRATASPAPAFACGSKQRCSQMSSCAEAQFYLQQCGLTKLDGNRDGVPCVSLCRR